MADISLDVPQSPFPTLDEVEQLIDQLELKGMTIPQAVMDDISAQNFGGALEKLSMLSNAVEEGVEVSGDIQNVISDQQALIENLNQNHIENPTLPPPNQAQTKVFNLKKAQMLGEPAQPPMDPMGLNDQPEMVGDPMAEQLQIQQLFFKDHAELKQWLEQQPGFKEAREALSGGVGRDEEVLDEHRDASANAFEVIDRMLEQFFSPGLEHKSNKEELRTDLANDIYDALPADMKPKPDEFQAEYHSGKVMYEKVIESSLNEIKKAASEAVKQKRMVTSFNLSKDKVTKTAQEKTLDNAFLWGPNEKRFDPFLRQPISDWHIVERNKGFGLTIDDHWNIDWESIWRGNIMDKYSRPYRDKDGNWVGGYIQKRFEVDKNIPDANNYQLKPGQRRKARPPEYGLTEGRLQAMRAKNERGYGPSTNTEEPFNWLKASAKKKLSKVARRESLTNRLRREDSEGSAPVVSPVDVGGMETVGPDDFTPEFSTEETANQANTSLVKSIARFLQETGKADEYLRQTLGGKKLMLPEDVEGLEEYEETMVAEAVERLLTREVNNAPALVASSKKKVKNKKPRMLNPFRR